MSRFRQKSSTKYTENKRHQETILANTFLAQLELLWKQVQYVSTVEAGTLVGWFYLWTNKEYLWAALLAGGSAGLLLLLLILIRRHAITLERYRRTLEHILFPSRKKGSKDLDEKLFGITLRGHVIARLIVFILICVNCLLCGVSFIGGCEISIRPTPVFFFPLLVIVAIIAYVAKRTPKWLIEKS